MPFIIFVSIILFFYSRRLSGVVVSVFATGPRGAGSNPAEAMDF
jgi:hypothetical protein